MFTVYILSLADGWLYVGQTQDLTRRLKTHTGDQSSSPDSTHLYIKAHGGVQHVTCVAEVDTREKAIEIEEQTVKNLITAGYSATCHPWRSLDGQTSAEWKSTGGGRLDLSRPV